MFMQRVHIFILLIIKVQGDSHIQYPEFPEQAQFYIETIINNEQHQRSIFECIYDYQRNFLWLINNGNDEFYNYTSLKRSIYTKSIFHQCQIYPIDIDNPSDGFSAVRNSHDHSTHIRSLDEFFLLTSKAKYLGETILRGYIHVHQWLTSINDDSEIIWSFAKSDYPMPWNTDNYTVPIQRLIRRKDDGLVLQILNIFSYKTRILKNDLTPPKGIFCPNLVSQNELISLQDIGMIFPQKFSIRIDISTNLKQSWQSIHLRYYFVNKQKFLRFDYLSSDKTSNSLTLIYDYSENLTRIYQIDRRTGFCQIQKSISWNFSSSILHNPIEFLIQYVDILLFNPPKQFFQYNGQRSCRGSIECDIYIGQFDRLPFHIEEDWSQITIEWAWSKRVQSQQYDYPVYLYLNLHQDQTEPSSNIQYEFYDYHTDVYLNEFDIQLCFRSNQYEYQHLVFQLEIFNQTSLDSIENTFINRRGLIEAIREEMIEIMSINSLRISQIELDHNENCFCLFTLLDRIPFSDNQSELSIVDAYKQLEHRINQGDFQLIIEDDLIIRARKNSLENLEYFHRFNPINSFVNTTIHINRTMIEKIEEIYPKNVYSYQIRIAAILSGIFVGILTGSIMIIVMIHKIKRKMNLTPHENIAFRNISFRLNQNRQQATITMETPN